MGPSLLQHLSAVVLLVVLLGYAFLAPKPGNPNSQTRNPRQIQSMNE
jgi:hypothetical protein